MKASELVRLLIESPNAELVGISKSGRRFDISGVEFALEEGEPVVAIRMEAQ